MLSVSDIYTILDGMPESEFCEIYRYFDSHIPDDFSERIQLFYSLEEAIQVWLATDEEDAATAADHMQTLVRYRLLQSGLPDELKTPEDTELMYEVENYYPDVLISKIKTESISTSLDIKTEEDEYLADITEEITNLSPHAVETFTATVLEVEEEVDIHIPASISNQITILFNFQYHCTDLVTPRMVKWSEQIQQLSGMKSYLRNAHVEVNPNVTLLFNDCKEHLDHLSDKRKQLYFIAWIIQNTAHKLKLTGLCTYWQEQCRMLLLGRHRLPKIRAKLSNSRFYDLLKKSSYVKTRCELESVLTRKKIDKIATTPPDNREGEVKPPVHRPDPELDNQPGGEQEWKIVTRKKNTRPFYQPPSDKSLKIRPA